MNTKVANEPQHEIFNAQFKSQFANFKHLSKFFLSTAAVVIKNL